MPHGAFRPVASGADDAGPESGSMPAGVLWRCRRCGCSAAAPSTGCRDPCGSPSAPDEHAVSTQRPGARVRAGPASPWPAYGQSPSASSTSRNATSCRCTSSAAPSAGSASPQLDVRRPCDAARSPCSCPRRGQDVVPAGHEDGRHPDPAAARPGRGGRRRAPGACTSHGRGEELPHGALDDRRSSAIGSMKPLCRSRVAARRPDRQPRGHRGERPSRCGPACSRDADAQRPARPAGDQQRRPHRRERAAGDAGDREQAGHPLGVLDRELERGVHADRPAQRPRSGRPRRRRAPRARPRRMRRRRPGPGPPAARSRRRRGGSTRCTRTPQSGSSSAGQAYGLVPSPLHSSTVGPSASLVHARSRVPSALVTS